AQLHAEGSGASGPLGDGHSSVDHAGPPPAAPGCRARPPGCPQDVGASGCHLKEKRLPPSCRGRNIALFAESLTGGTPSPGVRMDERLRREGLTFDDVLLLPAQ